MHMQTVTIVDKILCSHSFRITSRKELSSDCSWWHYPCCYINGVHCWDCRFAHHHKDCGFMLVPLYRFVAFQILNHFILSPQILQLFCRWGLGTRLAPWLMDHPSPIVIKIYPILSYRSSPQLPSAWK